MKQSGAALLLKKAIDKVVAASVLAVASPVLAATTVAVRVTMGSPVFFKQVRPGLGGRPFTIFKMRTMSDARDHRGELLPDAQRLTALGKLLRSTSLDELPQLVNVLRGELSLVGPRPLLMQYLPLYSPEQARRHDVLPGITGWAQVHGRNSLSWEDKFRHDVWYVDHWSPWLDAKILAMTALKVLRREGISQAGEATMANFTGSVVERAGL